MSLASADKRLITTRASAAKSSVKEPEKTGITAPMSALKVSATADLGNCLEGLTIVCSGIFEGISRDKLEEFINYHGGKCTGSVSGRTSYLIVGYKLEDNRDVTQGSKYRKAQELGTPILTEKEFETFVRKKSGKAEFTFANKIPELATIVEEVVMEEVKDPAMV